MPLIPDWVPNVHPLVIHFPVVILMLAILGDFISQFLRRRNWIPIAVTAIYVLGALAAVAAFATGHDAADSLKIPAGTIPALSDHSDWAEKTMWFFVLYAALRISLIRFYSQFGRKITVPLFLAALVGGYLLWGTADRGGRLVYRYGLAVEAHDGHHDEADDDHEHEEGEAGEDDHHEATPDGTGSLSWNPGSTSSDELHWLTEPGTAPDGAPVSVADGASAMRIPASEHSAIAVIGDTLASLQAEATLDLDSLKGRVALLYNVRDTGTYGFFSVENGHGILGRVLNGKTTVLERGDVHARGTVRIRIVADGRHFRGYVDDNLIAHGHGDELAPGRTGLLVEGSGSVLLRGIEARSLR